MDRLFLDACILFSAAYTPVSPLRKLWKMSGATLLASEFVIEEARRNLAALRPERLDDFKRLARGLDLVTAIVTTIPPEAKRLPDKDLPVLLAAVAGRATHLLTVDKKHFGPLFGKTVGQVRFLPPGEYLRHRA